MSWATTAVVVVGSLASAAVTYSGQRQQAKATKVAAAYNQRNAAIRAEEERRTAAENYRRKRRDNQRRLSTMRAGVGRSGLAFAGSTVDSLAESSSLLEREAGDVFRQGLARGATLDAQGAMTLFEGNLQGGAMKTAATMNLLSDVVSTAGSGYQTYKGV